jgi:hypothetical protein
MSKRRALGFKQLACKQCNSIVDKVDIEADAITCSDCVQLELMGGVRITEDQYWSLVKSGNLLPQDCTDSK